MAKRRHHTAFATAHSIYQHGRNAKYIYNRLRSKRRSTRSKTLTIDQDMQSTSMEVARNFQVTNAKKFSKAKPQTKDFFELYNLQTGISQLGGSINTLQGRQNYFGANYFMQYTDISSLTAATNGTNDHGRIYFHSMEIECLITNQSNWQIIIDIYDCMATSDVKQSIQDAWGSAAGVSTGGIGIGATSAVPTVIGVKPSDLTGFTNQWRPFKHNRVYINPGEVWIHKIFRFMNRKMNVQELMQSFSASGFNIYIPGITSGSLILTKGVPVHDTAHLTTTSGNQEMALVQTSRMRYSVIPESVSGDLLTAAPLLPTNFTGLTKMETETDNAAPLENA